MRFRKALVLLLILLLLLPLTACRRGSEDPVADPDPINDPEDPGNGTEDPGDDPADDPDDDPDPGPPEKTTLAGIALGDPASEVTRLFGRTYEEEFFFADEGYYGEDVAFRNYQDRIYFTIGQSTQQVLRIDVRVGDYETIMGTRVGQRAGDTLPRYRSYYPELVSIHTDEAVPGWFLVEDGGLLIFFFSVAGEPLFGEPIPDQAVIESITLAYEEHFD